jgi:hypothetical protein
VTSIGDRLLGVAVVLVSAALISVVTWAIAAENNWTARCHRAGGYNARHFEGLMPVGKVLMPRYSDHCIVDGREVRV